MNAQQVSADAEKTARIAVQCVVCQKRFSLPAESWRRYQEESGKAYVCRDCQEFDHTNGQS